MSSLADLSRFSLGLYTEGIRERWPDADNYRWIVHDLPRQFHARSAEEQRKSLRERVPLTHTRWDALLAAMVEHVATLHGHPVPAWVEEPERFLDRTWVVAKTPVIRLNSLMYAPAAFLRHGAIPDPRDLDRRGGSAMTGPLDRKRLIELFGELSEELRLTRTRAQIYIVGGGRCVTAASPPSPVSSVRRMPRRKKGGGTRNGAGREGSPGSGTKAGIAARRSGRRRWC